MKFNPPWESFRSCWNQKADDLKKCESAEETDEEGSSLLQFIATISGCISVMGVGTMLGWSSPSIPFLMSKESKIPITIEEGAWITSLGSLGNIIGSLMVVFLIDRIGRKYTVLLHAPIQIISLIIIIFSNSFTSLCCGRAVAGIASGGCLNAMAMYVGEIAEKKIRGMLSTFIVIFSDSGIFFVALIGAYFSYNTMNLVLLSIPMLHLFTFMLMPESPYFYLIQGRDNAAEKSLMRLRGLKNPKTHSQCSDPTGDRHTSHVDKKRRRPEFFGLPHLIRRLRKTPLHTFLFPSTHFE
ncbi:facilitated trehalose transporter Tret1-like [Belonocnema kinseyi]|uniref:facilitated trehalose transporter Tret1-like n=1 Tax=Belonocnema kinseyi TaxID=2817044 RepID=UPI00143D505A|nr:facilitated trehalose transporter Tret1-like [Belonocnema kinseyi]